VSVQTLHPTKFDHGELLAQTPLPGIPILDNMSAAELQLVLAAEGSKLLSKVIQHALFVQPITPIVLNDNNIKAITDGKGLSRAPKILKSDTKVKWDKMTADDILLRHCVFGSMWDENLFNDLDPTKNGTRIIFESLGKAELQETAIENLRDNPPGYAVLVSDDTLERIVIKAADSTFVELLDCTIAGEPRGSGKSLRKLKNLLQSKDHRIRSY
jgi:methionyl-tRNA formyltransferase